MWVTPLTPARHLPVHPPPITSITYSYRYVSTLQGNPLTLARYLSTHASSTNAEPCAAPRPSPVAAEPNLPPGPPLPLPPHPNAPVGHGAVLSAQPPKHDPPPWPSSHAPSTTVLTLTPVTHPHAESVPSTVLGTAPAPPHPLPSLPPPAYRCLPWRLPVQPLTSMHPLVTEQCLACILVPSLPPKRHGTVPARTTPCQVPLFPDLPPYRYLTSPLCGSP